MKKVILLGSTGSIGCNAIDVMNSLKGFRIVGLAAYTNHGLLLKQAKEIKPDLVTIVKSKFYNHLKDNLKGIKVYYGEEGITEMVENSDADTIICALASSLGVYAILKAIDRKMRVCLATKEILVSFGELIMQRVKKNRVEVIPIDSEHSAIYQCLEGRDMKDLMRIILTASGGPFLNKPMKRVKKSDVLKHPVWKMGTKITVDSATMMNKGLEVIEAHHLFGLPAEKIDIVIHPEAICHSLVQFKDGSLLAQLSTPDMRLPIQYALTAPQRFSSRSKCLEIEKVKSLTFQTPDFKKFPCLSLAYEALHQGRSMPAVLNAANAAAVKLFLEDKIKFNDIPAIIAQIMDKHVPKTGNIEDYIQAEKWAKRSARSLV